MTGILPAVPAIAAAYAIYLRIKSGLTPEITMDDKTAVLTAGRGNAALMLIFVPGKDGWQLSRIEVSRDGKTTRYAQGELMRAIASLLSHEPPAPHRLATPGPAGPRAGTASKGSAPP